MSFQTQNTEFVTTSAYVYARNASTLDFIGQMTKSEWDAICAVPPTAITGPKRGGNLIFTATLTGANLHVATADASPVQTLVCAIPAADWAVMLATLRCS